MYNVDVLLCDCPMDEVADAKFVFMCEWFYFLELEYMEKTYNIHLFFFRERYALWGVLDFIGTTSKQIVVALFKELYTYLFKWERDKNKKAFCEKRLKKLDFLCEFCYNNYDKNKVDLVAGHES